MTRKGSKLVYSTDPAFSKRCRKCGRYPCRCPKQVSLPPEKQTARITRERKGRGGKTVTVVGGLQLSPGDLKELGQQLRRLCGTGGTVKEGHVEIQGDHRDKIAEALRQQGYQVTYVGG